MEDDRLLVDLHKDAWRQGPGGDEETERALGLARVDRDAPLRVADMGCGTGASALLLARLSNARITAVDLFREFLDVLEERAEEAGVSGRMETLCASMEDLPFGDGEFDVIWSEGAIYNIGFGKGVLEWRRHLKTGGILAVSEITWLTGSRPSELQRHWEREYPGIDVASSKMGILETGGYSPIGYFVLPEHCWRDNYYRPMQARFDAFLERNGNSEQARAIVEAEQREIEMYEEHHDYYGYGMYIATKVDD